MRLKPLSNTNSTLLKEMIQNKILELNEQLMKELDAKFIEHLQTKLHEEFYKPSMDDESISYIVSLLLLIIYFLNKKEES